MLPTGSIAAKEFVFIPTLALMYDQVSQLQAKGIPTTALGSDGDRIDSLTTCAGAYIMYLTAEHIYGPAGESNRRLELLQQLADNGRVGLIALDEAHLLLEWENFRYVAIPHQLYYSYYSQTTEKLSRPSFRSLRRISVQFPTVPVMALTATAPPQLASDLELVLRDPKVFKGSVDCSNIIFRARKSKFGGQIPKSVTDGTVSACMLVQSTQYWKALVEELAPEIGDQPSIIYVIVQLRYSTTTIIKSWSSTSKEKTPPWERKPRRTSQIFGGNTR